MFSFTDRHDVFQTRLQQSMETLKAKIMTEINWSERNYKQKLYSIHFWTNLLPVTNSNNSTLLFLYPSLVTTPWLNWGVRGWAEEFTAGSHLQTDVRSRLGEQQQDLGEDEEQEEEDGVWEGSQRARLYPLATLQCRCLGHRLTLYKLRRNTAVGQLRSLPGETRLHSCTNISPSASPNPWRSCSRHGLL